MTGLRDAGNPAGSTPSSSLFHHVRLATIGQLLSIVAEPENPEERDAAWDEIARREGERLALKAIVDGK